VRLPSVVRQRRAQVAEARHGDDAEAARDQGLAEVEPLVEAAAGAVHDQKRRAIAGDSVFDRTAGRLGDPAAGRDAFTRAFDVVLISGIDQPASAARAHPPSVGLELCVPLSCGGSRSDYACNRLRHASLSCMGLYSGAVAPTVADLIVPYNQR